MWSTIAKADSRLRVARHGPCCQLWKKDFYATRGVLHIAAANWKVLLGREAPQVCDKVVTRFRRGTSCFL